MAWTTTRNGRYSGLYRDSSGRTRSAGTFATPTEAKAAAKAAEVDIARGEWFDPKSGGTLADFAVPFIERQTIKSVDNDRQYWKHLDAAFGTWPIGSITTRDIQDLIDAKAAAGCAKGTREKMRNLLSKIMKAALLQSPPLIKANPVPGVQIGSDGAPVERPYPTPAEVNAICDQMDTAQDRLMVRTFYHCGPRASELAGLDAGNLDPDARQLYIGGTKTTAASRSVPVPAFLCSELVALCAARDDDDPLFLSVTGRRINMPNWRKRVFNEARDRAGVAENVDLHALRHGALTNWAKYKIAVDDHQLMEWSGHSDYRTMLRYRHFFHTVPLGVADRLDEVMAGPRDADVLPLRRPVG